MSDALPYAFSNFDSYIKGQQTTIHQHYVRSISTLNFTVSSAVSNNLLVTIASHWYHKNEEGEVSTLNLTSENTPVRLVLAKFDPTVHGGFVELANIPFTVEQVNDHVAIRIREFGFKDYAGQPLFVLVKGNAYTEWGRNSTNTGTLFPTTSGASPPVIKERIIARFRLRDYQRRDTKTSVVDKPAILNGVSVINPFPMLYTSEKTVYGGQSIRGAEENKSHVILGVPIKNDWKRIKYIELQVSGGATALVDFNPELGPNDIIFRKPKAYYNNANSKENFIQINLLDVENPGTPKILEESDYFVKNTTKSDTIIYWLLRNVPVKAGDVVAINTHYDEDLSYTRKTIKVSLGGTKNRAYYTIAKQGTANGYLRFTANVGETEPIYGVKSDPHGLYPQSDKWLIDHVTDNLYVIMHYNTRKVLAAKGNKVIMVPYNQFDENHHWAIKAVAPDAYALINVGSTILAITDTETVLLNNENSALFTLTEIEAAPPIRKAKNFRLLNKSGHLALAKDEQNEATLVNPGRSDQITSTLSEPHPSNQKFQSFYLAYAGALQYVLFNREHDEFLYYSSDQGKLVFEKDSATTWYLQPGSGDFFSLTSTEGTLKNTGNGSIIVDKTANPTISKDAYQFRTISDERDFSLLADYQMEGNVRDSSLSEYHGTVHGVTFVNDNYRGKVASFNGTNAYIDLPDMTLPTGNGLSFETWVKFDQNASDARERVFDIGNGTHLKNYIWGCL